MRSPPCAASHACGLLSYRRSWNRCRVLGALLGIASLHVKRDDCTGLGLGGNEVRKLEFNLAAAQVAGADVIVCGGVVQSNTARQVAAACAKLGLECHLGIMHGRLAATEPGYEHTGNILLDRLYGAVIHDIPWDEDRNRRLRAIADDLAAAGRHVYFVPYGASDALGAMGYALAAEEIVTDLPDVAWIVHGSGSAGTQAGLLAGLLAMGHPARVIGVDVDAQAARVHADVCRVGHEAATLLGCGAKWDDALVEVAGGWSGPAYGVADATTEEAIRLAAQLEGLYQVPERLTQSCFARRDDDLIQGGERMRFAMATPLRSDFDASGLRVLARNS